MNITRLLGALIAGAIGAVAGAVATVLALFVFGTVACVMGLGDRLYVAIGVFVAVFTFVMVAVFRSLERIGLVREPPTSRSPLGLSAEPHTDD